MVPPLGFYASWSRLAYHHSDRAALQLAVLFLCHHTVEFTRAEITTYSLGPPTHFWLAFPTQT